MIVLHIVWCIERGMIMFDVVWCWVFALVTNVHVSCSVAVVIVFIAVFKGVQSARPARDSLCFVCTAFSSRAGTASLVPVLWAVRESSRCLDVVFSIHVCSRHRLVAMSSQGAVPL